MTYQLPKIEQKMTKSFCYCMVDLDNESTCTFNVLDKYINITLKFIQTNRWRLFITNTEAPSFTIVKTIDFGKLVLSQA